LRTDLHPSGLEVVTVSLELSGSDASRPYIEAAAPEHPSLLDPTHRLGELFGVVNIPSVIWIDEDGVIVRPPEAGWPDAEQSMPAEMFVDVPKLGRALTAPPRTERGVGQRAAVTTGQDRPSYVAAIRDWVAHGPDSRFALEPHEVVERSKPRPFEVSQAAAHFALAQHLWHAGRRDAAIDHFKAAHGLQPDNWTYKRQAWSLLGNERVGGRFGRWMQGPLLGEEADWPFDSDFRSDVSALGEGEYYPRTM
jgi:hypothetical protein